MRRWNDGKVRQIHTVDQRPCGNAALEGLAAFNPELVPEAAGGWPGSVPANSRSGPRHAYKQPHRCDPTAPGFADDLDHPPFPA